MYVSTSRRRVEAAPSDALVATFRRRAHRVSHDRIDPSLQAAIRLERLEHLHTYDVVAE